MKKIQTIIGALIISSASFAQNDLLQFRTGHNAEMGIQISKKSLTNFKTSVATAGDTVGRTPDFLPQFVLGDEILYRSSKGGSVFGKNGDSLNGCAQYYQNISNTPLKISKIILQVAKTSTLASLGTSYVKLSVYTGAPNKAYHIVTGALTSTPTAKGPNTALSTVTVNFSVLQAGVASNFVIINLPSQITITNDLVIGLDSRYLANGDTVGWVTDKKGDGAGLSYALQRIAIPASSTATAVYGNWIVANDIWSTGMDVNIAAFAVLDIGTAVNEYYNGVKLNAIYPNPTSNKATINYSLENNSKNISLIIYDVKGEKVYNENYNNQSAGNYSIVLNTENFEAGLYYYQLLFNGTSLTKELIIMK